MMLVGIVVTNAIVVQVMYSLLSRFERKGQKIEQPIEADSEEPDKKQTVESESVALDVSQPAE